MLIKVGELVEVFCEGALNVGYGSTESDVRASLALL